MYQSLQITKRLTVSQTVSLLKFFSGSVSCGFLKYQYFNFLWLYYSVVDAKHSRYVIFQMAEVMVSKSLFHEILERISHLKPVPIGYD